MMKLLNEIAIQIELHSADGIKKCFSKGVNPNDLFKERPLIYELIGEYTRSRQFKDCVKTFIDHGLKFYDEILLAVLAEDSSALAKFVSSNKEIINKKYSLPCAYTPLHEVTLLHICAEFNHIECAEVLVANGADVNAVAGLDENGFGGQTPIFHTVNQNSNQSDDVFNFLLSKSADLKITVPGLVWGRGYDWETLIPAVNPISYAMMGMLPQMHRDESVISKIVSELLKHAYGINYKPANVPCKYLL